MKSIVNLKIKSKEKVQFPTLYENEVDPLNSSQSRLSRISKKPLNNTARKSISLAANIRNSDKFATLKYGKDKELLFNIDCQVQSLIGFFNEKCKDELREELVTNQEYFDLIDDSGQNKNIYDTSIKNKSASLFIEPRKTYVLAKIKHNVSDEKITIPLIANEVVTHQPILATIIHKSMKKNSLTNQNKVNFN